MSKGHGPAFKDGNCFAIFVGGRPRNVELMRHKKMPAISRLKANEVRRAD